MWFKKGNTAAEFKGVSARDKAAAEFIPSPTFLEEMREAVQRDLVAHGETKALYWPRQVGIKRKDAPLVQQAFDKLKEEYAELNHFRIMPHGEIILDTRKNTFLRRFTTDIGAAPGF